MSGKTLASDIAALVSGACTHMGGQRFGPAGSAGTPIVIVQTGDNSHVGPFIQQAGSESYPREAPSAPMDAPGGEE